MHRFGLETGIDCAHFSLESGMVFEGIKGVYQRLYCFNFKCVRKKEKYANLRNLFFLLSISKSNDGIIT